MEIRKKKREEYEAIQDKKFNEIKNDFTVKHAPDIKQPEVVKDEKYEDVGPLPIKKAVVPAKKAGKKADEDKPAADEAFFDEELGT